MGRADTSAIYPQHPGIPQQETDPRCDDARVGQHQSLIRLQPERAQGDFRADLPVSLIGVKLFAGKTIRGDLQNPADL